MALRFVFNVGRVPRPRGLPGDTRPLGPLARGGWVGAGGCSGPCWVPPAAGLSAAAQQSAP